MTGLGVGRARDEIARRQQHEFDLRVGLSPARRRLACARAEQDGEENAGGNAQDVAAGLKSHPPICQTLVFLPGFDQERQVVMGDGAADHVLFLLGVEHFANLEREITRSKGLLQERMSLVEHARADDRFVRIA